MRLFGKVDGNIDRFDRAGWLTPPFDLYLLPVVPAALTLADRTSAATLNSRTATTTLLDRSAAATLNSRAPAVTLSDRAATLTLPSR